MTGKSPMGDDYENWGKEHYWRRSVFLLDIFWF
jgi:hypothetical protein